jgi:transposase
MRIVQRSFDERLEGIGRGGATAAVARDLRVPKHYLRRAVGRCRKRASARHHSRLGRHLAIDECALKKGHVYATVFSDPDRGVVIDLAPGRDGAAIWAFAGLYSHAERAAVAVVSMDCHNPYRYMVRIVFPNAEIVADAFHLHQQVLRALTEVRRGATVRIAKARRGRPGKAKAARHALARARDRLDADPSPRGIRDRQAVAEVCRLDDRLALAYQLKEAFRGGERGDTHDFGVSPALSSTTSE